MGDAVGQILASGVGIAISPIPLIAVVLMLATPRGRTNGVAFTAGWVVALTVLTTVVVLIGSGAGADGGGSTSGGVYIVKIVLGVVFLLLAARQWHGRPGPDEEPSTPGWMARLDSFTAVRAAGLAVALVAVNPKNLVLALGAGASISGSQGGVAGKVVAVAVFVLIGSLCALLPLGVYLFGGSGAARVLDGWKAWMAAHNGAIMVVLLLVLGAKYVGDGISGLTG